MVLNWEGYKVAEKVKLTVTSRVVLNVVDFILHEDKAFATGFSTIRRILQTDNAEILSLHNTTMHYRYTQWQNLAGWGIRGRETRDSNKSVHRTEFSLDFVLGLLYRIFTLMREADFD